MIGSFKIFWEKKFIFSCVIWSCTHFHRWTLKISLFNTLKAWRLNPLDDIVKSLAAEYWHKLYKMWYDFFQYWCFWLLCDTKHACRFDYRLTFNNKTCQWYISSMIYFLPINVYRKEIENSISVYNAFLWIEWNET